MGKVLFLDEDRMHVPLIVGSLTDEGFVSADNCYLRNSQMGELRRKPHCLSAFHALCQIHTIDYSLQVETAEAGKLHEHTHDLCSSLLQTCQRFPPHIVCMICPLLARLAQNLCRYPGTQVSLVLCETSADILVHRYPLCCVSA